MRKLKHFFKKLWKQIKLYCSMPHVITTGVIMIATVITGVFSYSIRSSNDFVSSFLANICAGLITGVVLCFVSATKSISVYRTESIIRWLKQIHEEYIEFNKTHHKLIYSKPEDFNTEEELYESMYDVLCLGNAIDGTISQSQFDNRLPFNPTKYCKKEFDYNVIAMMKKNYELREKVMDFNLSSATSTKIHDLFEDMDSQYFDLNSKVLKKITEFEIRLKALKITII